MIDSHCHLNYIEKSGTVADIINNATENGVHTIINIGTDLKSSQLSVEYSKQFPSVYASVGIHPSDSKHADLKTLEKIKELSQEKKVVAIGEIGLDYYRDHSPRDVQKKIFIKQLEMAVETKHPIVIHTRDAFDDTYAMVKDFVPDISGGVFHCFQGTIDEAEKVLNLGFVISVGGIITFKKASQADIAAEVPLEKILLETDAPFLAPVPYRGKTNRPALVKYVYQHLAELKNISVAEVEKTVDRSVQKLFKLVETFGD